MSEDNPVAEAREQLRQAQHEADQATARAEEDERVLAEKGGDCERAQAAYDTHPDTDTCKKLQAASEAAETAYTAAEASARQARDAQDRANEATEALAEAEHAANRVAEKAE